MLKLNREMVLLPSTKLSLLKERTARSSVLGTICGTLLLIIAEKVELTCSLFPRNKQMITRGRSICMTNLASRLQSKNPGQ